MTELYIELRRRSLSTKEMASAEAPAFSMGCRSRNLEYELQSELDLSCTLGPTEVPKVGIAGRDSGARIKRAVRRPSEEGVDRPIE